MEHFVIPEFEKLIPDDELTSYIRASVKTFSDITGVPVTFFSSENEVIFEYNRGKKICSMLGIYKKKSGQCRKLLSFAGRFSSELGEPYIFLCKSGMTNICVPLLLRGRYCGYFIAGPLVMEKLRNSIIANFSKMNRLSPGEAAMVNGFASSLPIFRPDYVTKLSLLFYNSILASVGFPQEYLGLRKNINEQSNVSAKIRTGKKTNLSDDFPLDLHKALLSSIEQGDTLSAIKIVEDIHERFSILCVGNLEEIKTLSLWMSALISKFISDNGSDNFNIDIDLDVINRIAESESFEELLDVSRDIVRHISGSMLSSVYSGSSALISQALKYIMTHFPDNIGLNSVCDYLHVNPSYFSTLFRQEMNRTFTDYLTELRIEKACKLLLETNLRIVDISSEVGFEDQSYFNKVFKKSKNLTPREFRQKNTVILK